MGSAPPGRRNGRVVRASTQSVFAELLDLASIPQTAYALDEEVPGAICLIKTDGGFEVFSRTDDARLEERFFEDEEAAYFYLFGVLAAEAVRSGRLGAPRCQGVQGRRPAQRLPHRTSRAWDTFGVPRKRFEVLTARKVTQNALTYG